MTSLRRPATALAALLTAGLTASVLAAPGSAVADRPDAARGQQVGQAAAKANAKATEKHVIAISVDGLNPRALKKLGTTGTPNLRRLILDEGAGTLNARSQLEMTVTLPNHTSMVTGRRIKAAKGGHGVTWNTDTVTKTVQQAAGHAVDSVFTQVHAAGGTTAVYSTKEKFWLFENSWPAAVDKNVIRVEDDKAIVTALRDDLASQPANFSFVHLGRPDQMGHKFGWMSKRYLKGVAKIDRLVGSIMATVESTPSLKNSTTIVLTSDHGGIPGTRNHVAKKNRENYRVVFAFWGSDVPNKSLYALNPDRANPKKGRPGFGADVQPIRNGEIANASLDLLGIMPVPDSLWDYKQDLNWK